MSERRGKYSPYPYDLPGWRARLEANVRGLVLKSHWRVMEQHLGGGGSGGYFVYFGGVPKCDPKHK